MKTICLLMVFRLFLSTAYPQSLLNKEINVETQKGSINELLKYVSNTAKVSFSYSSEIETNKLSALNAGKKSIYSCLTEIFEGSVRFIETRNKIILSPKNNSDTKCSHITIRGRIVDKRTNSPIVAANVYLSHLNKGTISDDQGKFLLSIKPTELSGPEKINISFLGYETERFIVPITDTTIVISLKPSSTNVNEVVIEHHNPELLIRKVINKIATNYEAEPVLLTAFFREKTYKDQQCNAASEALVEVLKESYMSWRFDQVKYIAGRSLEGSHNGMAFTVEGGLYYNLKPDVIKNRAEFLDPEKIKDFSFRYHGLTKVDDYWCYIVSFVQQAGESLPYYSGYLYIDRESFGIAKAIYFPNLEIHPDRIAEMFVVKHPLNIIPKIGTVNYTIDYRRIKNTWHLSKVKSNIDINFKLVGQDKITNFTTISEYIIINADHDLRTDWNPNQSTSKKDVLSQQIRKEDKYLWSASRIDTEEAIEYTVASILRDNPFIKSNLFDHRDYIVVLSEISPDKAMSDNNSEKEKVFLTKSNNIAIYSSNKLYLGKHLDSYDPYLISLPGASTDPLPGSRQSAATAMEILTKAVQCISHNYPTEKATYTAYYREEIKTHNQTQNISDALVNITKERYTHWHNDEIRLVSGRSYSPGKEYKEHNFVLQGGLTSNLQIDIVKYRANFIDPNYFEYYDYHYIGTDSINHRMVYIIEFDQKDNVFYPFFKGRLYIDKETFAIAGADYGYSPKMIDMASNILIVKVPDKAKLKLTESRYTVTYVLTDSVWHLRHITGLNTFSVVEKKSNNQVKNSEFSTSSEYLITHLSPFTEIFEDSKPISQKEVLAKKINQSAQPRHDIWQGLSILNDKPITEFTNELFEKEALAGEFQTVLLQ